METKKQVEGEDEGLQVTLFEVSCTQLSEEAQRQGVPLHYVARPSCV